MLHKRVQFTGMGQAIPAQSRQGTGFFAALTPTIIATNADLTLTVAQMSGGLVQFSSFSAGRAVTTPTAALILAAATDMDVGDSFSFIVSCVAAFAATWTAGTDVTLTGRATTPASSWSIVTVTKTSATTVSWNVT
jgi:TRAP-type mannitol/chloroaromatic compound transport system substrate-binding protein